MGYADEHDGALTAINVTVGTLHNARNSINLSFIIYYLTHVWIKTGGLIQRHLHKRITLLLKDQRGTLYTYNLLLSKSDFPFTYDNVKWEKINGQFFA